MHRVVQRICVCAAVMSGEEQTEQRKRYLRAAAFLRPISAFQAARFNSLATSIRFAFACSLLAFPPGSSGVTGSVGDERGRIGLFAGARVRVVRVAGILERSVVGGRWSRLCRSFKFPIRGWHRQAHWRIVIAFPF